MARPYQRAAERGEREPSLTKYQELLAAVAPDLVLTIGERLGPVAAPAKPRGKAKARKAS